MCHWRRVRNTYLVCGHAYDLPDEMITCEDRHCRFSPAHPSHCVLPNCASTCWQYRQSPQQYNPQIDTRCPLCMNGNRRTSTTRNDMPRLYQPA